MNGLLPILYMTTYSAMLFRIPCPEHLGSLAGGVLKTSGAVDRDLKNCDCRETNNKQLELLMFVVFAFFGQGGIDISSDSGYRL